MQKLFNFFFGFILFARDSHILGNQMVSTLAVKHQKLHGYNINGFLDGYAIPILLSDF
jgi:hypothetical protein